METNQIRPNWKIYSWLAAAGLIIYLALQIIPSTADTFFGSTNESVIKKSAAEQVALDFASQQFKEKPLNAHAIHQSDSLLVGYLAKEKLDDNYEKKYDTAFPTDTYQIQVQMQDLSELFIYVHMQKGTVVSWNRLHYAHSQAPEGNELSDTAFAFAVSKGFKMDQLKMSKVNPDQGIIWLDADGYNIGEAKLVLKMRSEKLENGNLLIAEYKPQFIVPSSYETYVKQQNKLANSLSLFGNSLMTFALFVLAIIYAVKYRKHTSFVRGIVLTLLFLAMYIINDFNMMDGILSSYGESSNSAAQSTAALYFTVIVTVVIGISVYFSLVGGDGLWRAMGHNLWPRFGEKGYGEHVWRSMWLGYLIAFMLLGLQTIIFIILMKVTGAWSTSDVSQSPYNLATPLLFPLMAWCAAISEEATYRLFGIGLLKRWFNNTFVASLIPTIIWALGHVTYPIFPSTTRLLELTILGLIFSLMFVRYGFITVVFAHAVFDSVMMAITLLFMGSAGNIILGVIYLILPIPIAWLLRLSHNKFSQRKKLA